MSNLSFLWNIFKECKVEILGLKKHMLTRVQFSQQFFDVISIVIFLLSRLSWDKVKVSK